MPESDWTETFDLAEDIYGEEAHDSDDGEAAEFILPALGFAAAKKFMGPRGKRRPLPTPAGRDYVRPIVQSRVPATQSQLAGGFSRVGEDFKRVNAATKALEARLDTYSRQLAVLQQQKTGEHAGDLFRYALTTYLSGATAGVIGREWGQLAIQALPLIQAMVTGRGGVSSSLSMMPWSTALFPLGGTLAVTALRKPKPPVITMIENQFHITADLLPISTTRYTINGKEPASSDEEYKGPFRISMIEMIRMFFNRRRKIKAKTFSVLGIESDTASYDF